ncbi:MAG TPA: beta-L-arabinofuranosidase domain-containing protein [Verrucomicrobiae bacterium]|nr:beta-L-arabinofuranosidase domain-containing protein [Verrucomicrobiae bacterium]
MSRLRAVSRRTFLQSSALASAAGLLSSRSAGLRTAFRAQPTRPTPLEEFGYGDVSLESERHEQQLRETHAVLMGLNEDSLMKPFRAMSGKAAPGEDLGGWYEYVPNYDWHTFDVGFAPAATFGQWVSALARSYAIDGSPATREKVLRLNRLYAEAIDAPFFQNNRFPAYCYDKLVCGLIDSQKFVGDPQAWAILKKTTDTALPHLPPHAVEHGTNWRPGKDVSWSWDESYTMPENLFLAYQRGAGERYRELAVQYLHDQFYDRLASGQNDLAGRHAYSHVNCLCSAMQAYLTLGSEKHLRAAKNGFDMVQAQSFATGGWGPDEQLRATGSPDVYDSLSKTHSGFETPCGSYAHFKLTRYLLRVTRDPRYGDSMERVMYNTILGAKPLEPDGRTFYYSDYNFKGQKLYSPHRWPCCSGTMPQVVADYRTSTYFRDGRDVYVNLYIPSSVRWTQDGAPVALTQKTEYPYESSIRLEVRAAKAAKFAVNLRIPAWADNVSFAVNGKRETAAAGAFARIEREWKNGDRIDLELPMATRLEPVDPQHADTVALLVGPLVLFSIGESQPAVTREQLLAAKKMAQGLWHVLTPNSPMKMVTWTTLGDQPYMTYLRLA